MIRGLGGILVVAVALASLAVFDDQLGLPSFYLVLLTTALFWTAQATSWNLLSGYSGYFSFGQGAYVGIGAYSTAVLSGRHGYNFFVTLPIAGGLGATLALVTGWLAFRLRSLRGEVFALLTMAVPFILAAIARSNTAIDGGEGITLPVPSIADHFGGFTNFLYLLDLVVAVFAVVVAFLVQRSRFGWALAAIRDSEDVAETAGVATFRYKMQAIVLSGLIGGLSGATFALQIGFVTVDSAFALTIPVFVIVMCVLGGRSHWLGPVLGAALIVLLQDRLSTGGLTTSAPIILGGILVVLVVIAPNGLYEGVAARPWLTGATLAVVTGGLAAVHAWGGFLDWLLVGMLTATVVAIGSRLLPGRRPAARVPEAHVPAQPLVPVRARSEVAGRAVVECRNVTKSFGGVRALQDVTLCITEGEIIGLVGPNGSGKSTLVGVLSGALRPSTGHVQIVGTNATGLAPHRIVHLGVARTYQVPRPFGSMTVRDNVAMAIMFGRGARPLREARPDAERHLRTVGLDRLADSYPGALNLHQRQLLEMARAIATEPRLLLLDEALAGLNPAEIDNAVEVVRRIHQTGITIVIVEHLLRVLNQLASRIVVLNMGSCLADGDPQLVMNDPAVVRAYLGGHAHA
jgi:branched-chain amino acid transport system permease protein